MFPFGAATAYLRGGSWRVVMRCGGRGNRVSAPPSPLRLRTFSRGFLVIRRPFFLSGPLQYEYHIHTSGSWRVVMRWPWQSWQCSTVTTTSPLSMNPCSGHVIVIAFLSPSPRRPFRIPGNTITICKAVIKYSRSSRSLSRLCCRS